MALLRLCLDCSTPTTDGRCTRCRANRYGTQHQAERDAWLPHVATGQVACWRCRELIGADQPFDLGHLPNDDSRHPEHQHCNRSAAASGQG